MAPLKIATATALLHVPANGTTFSFVVQGSRTPNFLIRVSGPGGELGGRSERERAVCCLRTSMST